jgi:hypothetical protein
LVTVVSWISRPFGPYHSPQASNSGDWWVVLGLDLLRSDWSKIGGWLRSLAESPNVGCDYSARHQPTGRRPSAPPPRVPVGGSAECRGGSYLASVTLQCSRQLADRFQLCGRPQFMGRPSALVYPTCRPFGPYHSPPASNWGDWWVVLGLDPLCSDWSQGSSLGSAVGFAASRSSPCLASPLGINRLAGGVRLQIPFSFSRWPYLVRVCGRRDGSYLPQSPQVCGFPLWLGNWRIVQVCSRRHMYGTVALVYPTCLPVAPLGRQTGTTASDLAVLTGDLVLADDQRFPFCYRYTRSLAGCLHHRDRTSAVTGRGEPSSMLMIA